MSKPQALYCRIPSNWQMDPSLCWYEWQTLISGILAIAAAVIAAALLHSQINQTERHEQDRRNRRLESVRASLPLVLSQICGFAREMVVQLVAARRDRPSNTTGPVEGEYNPPELTREIINDLRAFIEASDNAQVNALLSEIIRELQVLTSRARSLIDAADTNWNSSIPTNLDEYIVQAARLHTITGNLFEFARGEAEGPPDEISWDSVSSFLFFRHVEKDDFPGVYAILERRSEAWQSLWPKVKREGQAD